MIDHPDEKIDLIQIYRCMIEKLVSSSKSVQYAALKLFKA